MTSEEQAREIWDRALDFDAALDDAAWQENLRKVIASALRTREAETESANARFCEEHRGVYKTSGCVVCGLMSQGEELQKATSEAHSKGLMTGRLSGDVLVAEMRHRHDTELRLREAETWEQAAQVEAAVEEWQRAWELWEEFAPEVEDMADPLKLVGEMADAWARVQRAEESLRSLRLRARAAQPQVDTK